MGCRPNASKTSKCRIQDSFGAEGKAAGYAARVLTSFYKDKMKADIALVQKGKQPAW